MSLKDIMLDYFYNLTDPSWMWNLVLFDMLCVFVMLLFFKQMVGIYSKINFNHELCEKDNPAYGIVVGFLFLSFFLIMSAASSGDTVVNYGKELMLMIGYGLSGVFMLLSSKFVFDNVSMREFHIKEQLSKRNKAVAIVDGGNALATALIVFAYMGWVKSTSLNAIMVVAYGWVLSQVSLSLYSYIKKKTYRSSNGETLVENIESGNIAVAVKFVGYRLSFAMTPLIALPHFVYDEDWAMLQATNIFFTSVILSIVYIIMTKVCMKLVFLKTNINDEINRQHNIGLAFVEAMVIMGITFMTYGMLK